MSNTRYARNGEPFSQERFCSSHQYEQGMLANLVARRCELLNDPRKVELIFFLQYLSHQKGGIKKVANDIRAIFPKHVTGPSVRLESDLMDFCLDPEWNKLKSTHFYFPQFINTLEEFKSIHAARTASSFAETEISRLMFETLDYGFNGGCLVMAQGHARTGKTIAAKAWCQMRPGLARYVQVPASNDDISFFRAIAQALGISSAFSLKGVQMRERIEQVLQSSKLMLVFDEAHYLWPQNNRREALPNRINWILTALVNFGVPVALVTTPQFTVDQKTVEKKTGWASAQFMGRIALYKPLPDRLSQAEVIAIARHYLPEGSEKSIQLLSDVTELSKSYVAGIEHAVNRARHEASKEGRKAATYEDVKRAVANYALPTERALNEAIHAASGKPTKATRPAAALKTDATTPAPENPRRSAMPECDAAATNRLAPHEIT